MIEQPKRSSRLKKNPKYFHSDIYNTLHPDQAVQKWDIGSGKASQNIMAQQTIAKTSDSKMLINFINKVNKSYQDYRNQMAQENMHTIKKQLVQKEKKEQDKTQGNKKISYKLKQMKMEIAKKNKELGKLKNSYNNTKQPENMNNSRSDQNYMDKIKLAQQQIGLSANMTMNGVYSDSLKKQYDKLQNLYKLNTSGQNSINQNQYQIGISNSSQFNSSKSNQKSKKENHKNNQASIQQRVFKRNAYHVAIAYHIYLKKLKEKKGPNIQYQIDPTYFARRLKQTKTDNPNQ